jgi:(2Fe-2S) ferredoxin
MEDYYGIEHTVNLGNGLRRVKGIGNVVPDRYCHHYGTDNSSCYGRCGMKTTVYGFYDVEGYGHWYRLKKDAVAVKSVADAFIADGGDWDRVGDLELRTIRTLKKIYQPFLLGTCYQ